MKLALVISRCLLCRVAKAQLSSAGMVKGMRCMDTKNELKPCLYEILHL